MARQASFTGRPRRAPNRERTKNSRSTGSDNAEDNRLTHLMADDDELLAELELTGANDVDEQFSVVLWLQKTTI